MRMILMLALVAGLSACATSSAHPPTEASIAKAADRAVGIETGYAAATELAAFGAPALGFEVRAKIANGDRIAFGALVAGRAAYPLALSLAPADAVRLAVAIDRSNDAHDALQHALAPPG